MPLEKSHEGAWVQKRRGSRGRWRYDSATTYGRAAACSGGEPPATGGGPNGGQASRPPCGARPGPPGGSPNPPLYNPGAPPAQATPTPRGQRNQGAALYQGLLHKGNAIIRQSMQLLCMPGSGSGSRSVAGSGTRVFTFGNRIGDGVAAGDAAECVVPPSVDHPIHPAQYRVGAAVQEAAYPQVQTNTQRKSAAPLRQFPTHLLGGVTCHRTSCTSNT